MIHSLRLNANFVNYDRTKMPYEEVYFQRMEEENSEDYPKIKFGKKE